MNHTRPKHYWPAVTVIGFALAAVPVLEGCPGSLDLGPFTAPPCNNAATDLLVPKCATAGCHSGSAPAGSLDLTAGALSSLDGKKAMDCNALLLDPVSPEKSVLYLKVTGETCGARMPFGEAPLFDSQQACLLAWIKGQANGGAGGSGGTSGSAGGTTTSASSADAASSTDGASNTAASSTAASSAVASSTAASSTAASTAASSTATTSGNGGAGAGGAPGAGGAGGN